MIRVTEVLQRAGVIKGTGFFTEEARWRGSAVHQALEYDDQGDLDPATVDADLWGYVNAWRRFKQETGFKPRLIEHEVIHQTLGYIGHLDREGPLRAQPTIVDMKTGAIGEWVRLQTVAYGYGLDSKQHFGRVAVRLNANGTYNCRSWPVSLYGRDLHEWITLLRTVQDEL